MSTQESRPAKKERPQKIQEETKEPRNEERQQN